MAILEFIQYKQIIQQLAQKGGEKFVQVAGRAVLPRGRREILL